MSTSSWRINVREIDFSQTLSPVAGSTMATVVRADRGPMEPVYIPARNSQHIVDIFGVATPERPDIWEAIQGNRQSPIWISAPHDDSDYLAGVSVSETGVSAFDEYESVTQSAADSGTYSFSGEYFILLAKSPSDTIFVGVELTYNSNTEFFTLTTHKSNDGGETWTEVSEDLVSLDPEAKDGFGRNVYIEEVINRNDFLQVIVNPDATVGSFVDTTEIVALDGGSRTTADATMISAGWDYFKQVNTRKADIFFDTTKFPEVVAKFEELRDGYQVYSSYILPLPMGEDWSDAIDTKAGFSVDNRGLAFYWNHGLVRDTFSGRRFWTPLTGRVAVKYAQMETVFNGKAPSWIDENDHGGQLGGGIIKMEFDPSEDVLRSLDSAGINPIVFSQNYGVMIVSQRTAKSPTVLSDDSWIGHSRLFDYILYNIVTFVLPFQITKLNDALHRSIARSNASTILNPIVAEGLLSEALAVCDTSNNTPDVLAQRQFVLSVFVRVTPFSERIQLNFIKVGQNITIEELTA